MTERMDDDRERAARFYGADKSKAPGGASTQNSAGSLLSGGDPLTDRERADLWYGSDESLVSSLGPALADNINALSDATGMSAEDRQATVTELARAFHDARVHPTTAASIGKLILHHSHTPVDEQQQAAWFAESNKALRERYGDDDGPKRLEIVREFVKKRPELERMIRDGGVGDYPALVLSLAENAYSLRVTPPANRTPLGGATR